MRARLIVPLALVALLSTAAAKVRDFTPEELKERSTHIVCGRIQANYSYDEIPKPGASLKYTRFVAEILVEESTKGDGPKKGEVIYVRWFRESPANAGVPAPSGGGHDEPEVGKSYTAHVTKDKDGGYSALLPNGFVPAK